MDATLNALAHKLRAEMQEEAPRHQTMKPEQRNHLRHWLGSLLVHAGQKLQAQAVSQRADTELCLEEIG